MSDQKAEFIQISSNATLFFKLFIPIFWVIFFGAFTASAYLTHMYESFSVAPHLFRIYVTVFFVIGVLLLYFSFWQLKRVEFSEDRFYATNYFKHYQYSYSIVKQTSILNFIFFRILVIELSQKTSFGKRITCILSRKRLMNFKEKYPGVLEVMEQD